MKINIGQALIFNEKKILLCENKKYRDTLKIPYMSPPQGRKEWEESIRDCIVREAYEECGLEVEVRNLIGIYNVKSERGDFRIVSCIAAPLSLDIKINDTNEIENADWYSLDQVLDFKERKILVPSLEYHINKDKLRDYFRWI